MSSSFTPPGNPSQWDTFFNNIKRRAARSRRTVSQWNRTFDAAGSRTKSILSRSKTLLTNRIDFRGGGARLGLFVGLAGTALMAAKYLFGRDYAYEHPAISSLGLGESELYRYYTKAQGEDPEFLEELADIGDAGHKILEASAKKIGARTEVEINIPGWDARRIRHGFADIVYPGNVVSDVKTVSKYKLKEIERIGPRMKDIEQVNLYAYALKSKIGMVEYVDRDDLSRRRAISFVPSKKMALETIERYNRVRKRIDRDLRRGKLKRSQLRTSPRFFKKERELPPEDTRTPEQMLEDYERAMLERRTRKLMNSVKYDMDLPFRAFANRTGHIY